VTPAALDARRAAEVAALLRDAARADILPRFRRLEAAAVRAKSGPLDLVTDADEAAERRIEVGLRTIFPGCLVVGEEGAARDPTLLRQLGEADLAFLVDPIDGTANFVAGVPVFGCMAAALRRGEVVAGWIHDPVGGDDTAIALRGQGAWVEDAAGRRKDLRVAAPAPVSHMVAAISWGFMPEPLKSRVTGNLPRLAATVGYRCAAQEYRLAAAGHLHLLVYQRLLPWDHAPGWLLHREAGGFGAQFDGRAYSPLVHSGGLICAPDEAGWAAARAALGIVAQTELATALPA
jgi:fructose-1,6-bisphosphatase/inositol monophosphatase family enzyme